MHLIPSIALHVVEHRWNSTESDHHYHATISALPNVHELLARGARDE